MNRLLKTEEILRFALGIYFLSLLHVAWGWFLLLILAPDLGMFGYVLGNKIGALTYNLTHHKGLAIAPYLFGSYLSLPLWQLAGVILFSHSAMDRIFGYGLKYDRGFKMTHLGEIGNANG